MAYTKSAKIAWTGEALNFSGTLDSGYPIEMKNISDEDGASPMSILLTGVAGCTAMDVLSIVQKKRQEVVNMEVEIVGVRADSVPMVFTDVDITYRLYGQNLDPVAVERAIELSQTKYCSASVIFQRAGVNIRTHYEIREPLS
jgi:putative redox protein